MPDDWCGQNLATHHDIALVIKLNLTPYDAAVGLVPDAIEEPFDGQLPPLACAQPAALNRAFAQHSASGIVASGPRSTVGNAVKLPWAPHSCSLRTTGPHLIPYP